ncbi:MAG: low molecular weight phosphatase family protein [Oscillatoriaceae bacterium SKW80]|nr:low molecular weight phosphatase family protein [Oscillatoriaceae bacterium SKYG93]MCX8119334.1 low molecular weight phosphatase family protein [Oscillatoriaceae bacterium SKW80]MDW8454801.1 low molecular weight phosphatase family protein [Oscillatoriaceae cyanobacterium SKYGB_i_bin93]HIK28418.1 low molecular weight phosphatase family protein [Oscillatoriaceae cyanobacterium M7585_C2015_266]
MKKILFLCTGNYYRSRFAEYLFNFLAEKQGINWRAFSRGLAIERGVNNIGAISPYAREALKVRGCIISENERLPLQAKEKDFAEADQIIALNESEHRPLIRERFPNWEDVIKYWQINDINKTPVEEALSDIEQQVKRLISILR